MSEQIEQREVDISGYWAVYHPKNWQPIALFNTREAAIKFKNFYAFGDQIQILQVKRKENVEKVDK